MSAVPIPAPAPETVAALTNALDLFGVGVFAASGALEAARKRMDLFGFALMAAVTGVGGGTLRDLMLGAPVAWVKAPTTLGICVAVAAIFFLSSAWTGRWAHGDRRALLWLDAVGLAFAATASAAKAFDVGAGPSIAVAMGVVGATFGGVIRDVLGGETPAVMSREVYVTAALAGALVYAAARGLGEAPAGIAGFAVAFAVRAAGLHWSLSLPRFGDGTAA